MKTSHSASMFLLAASTLISQALSMPYGNGNPSTLLPKRGSGVAYAGINIAGCDFGIDTSVSKVHSTLDEIDAKTARVILQALCAQAQ